MQPLILRSFRVHLKQPMRKGVFMVVYRCTEITYLLYSSAVSPAVLLPALATLQLPDFCILSDTLQGQPSSTSKAAEAMAVLPEGWSGPLIKDADIQNLKRKVLSSMQQQCREAQRLQQGAGASWRSVPLWGWLLLLALGWNELATVVGFAFSNWVVLLLLLPLLSVLIVAAVSGKLEIAGEGVNHFLKLFTLVARPVVHGALKKVADMIDVRDGLLSHAFYMRRGFAPIHAATVVVWNLQPDGRTSSRRSPPCQKAVQP